MSLVNQSHHLIAILLQFLLLQIEDLVTVRNPLFYLQPWIFIHNYLIGSINPIHKLCFAILESNFSI